LTAKDHDDPMQEGINQVHLARTLLRIVAELAESEYSDAKSNGRKQRQVAERELNDLPNPASDTNTTQG